MIISADQAPMSDKMKVSLEESPDEDDSQATDSVIGDPDISQGYSDCINTEKEDNASFYTLPSIFSTWEVNKDDDSDNERVSCLDGIGASFGKLPLSDQGVNTNPNSESVEELLQPCAKQSPSCSTATIVDKPHPAAKVKASHGQLKSETNTVPQLKEIALPTDTTGMRSNTTQSKVSSSPVPSPVVPKKKPVSVLHKSFY